MCSIGAITLVRYEFWGPRDATLVGNTLHVNLFDASVDLGLLTGDTWVDGDELVRGRLA